MESAVGFLGRFNSCAECVRLRSVSVFLPRHRWRQMHIAEDVKAERRKRRSRPSLTGLIRL